MNYFRVSPNKIAVKIYRISNSMSRKKIFFLAVLFQRLNLLVNGVEIHHAAQIGKDLILVHSVGTVIGKNVIIGKNAKIYSSVVLGVKNFGSGEQPVIGNNVILSTGSKILGNIIIGNNCIIGANAVVLEDVPDNHTAVGVPANFKKNNVKF